MLKKFWFYRPYSPHPTSPRAIGDGSDGIRRSNLRLAQFRETGDIFYDGLGVFEDWRKSGRDISLFVELPSAVVSIEDFPNMPDSLSGKTMKKIPSKDVPRRIFRSQKVQNLFPLDSWI